MLDEFFDRVEGLFKTSGRKRGKRKRTPRDDHMSKCMKETPGPVQDRMKICAASWKAKQG
jgi:hypothetical protein